MNKILLIGCGHMGSALLKSWHQNSKNEFTIVDPKKYIAIKNKYRQRVNTFKHIKKIKDTKIFSTIVLAVKPQFIEEVMKDFKNFQFNKNILVISIIAGKKISFFINFLPKRIQFVRVMPNMPALINQGMTCLVSNRYLTKKNKIHSSTLFKMVGQIIWLNNESDLDKITAISGSGPAYYFLFIDILQKVSHELGLNKNISKKLVEQTALGSIKLLFQNDKNAEQLTQMIAIKGGTTEAAVNIFRKKNQLKKIIKSAVNSAFKRARELGK